MADGGVSVQAGTVEIADISISREEECHTIDNLLRLALEGRQLTESISLLLLEGCSVLDDNYHGRPVSGHCEPQKMVRGEAMERSIDD